MSSASELIQSRAFDLLTEVQLRGGLEFRDYILWTPMSPASSTSVYTDVNGFGALTPIDPSGGGVSMFCSSESIADTDVKFMIEGLNNLGNYQVDTSGTTDAVDGQVKTQIGTLTNWAAIFRTTITGTKENGDTLHIYEDDTVTAGVPDTQAKRKDAVISGFNRSMNGYFRVPTSKKMILMHWESDGDTFSLLSVRLMARSTFGDVYPVLETREGIPISNSSRLSYVFNAGTEVKFESIAGSGVQNCDIRACVILQDV